MRKAINIIALLVLAATCGVAQKPRVTNAKIQELPASSGLKAVVDSILQKQDSPAWIGYSIPSTPKERNICCFVSWDAERGRDAANKCCMGCKLESNNGSSFSGTDSNCTQPEPAPYSFVLYRVEQHKVSKVRVYSADCPLDFSNLPLYWLQNVDPAQSIAVLTDFALSYDKEQEDDSRSKANHAVQAIALHDNAAADQALEKLLQPDKPEGLRKHVIFWLAIERGKPGLALLRKYVPNDPSDDFRKHGTFAFSQSKEPDAIKDLISMAHNDPSPHVRGQAIFWMAQIGGRKEAQQITDAIENDPGNEVKKRAVFALSQMRDGEGVPMLINVAKTNKNPVVRKEAIRWLGMTNDPRALDYLEQILTK
jgi:HEAT repeat protein